jgi:hypothetical protein
VRGAIKEMDISILARECYEVPIIAAIQYRGGA